MSKTETFARGVVKWRWPVVLLTLAAMALITSGGRFLSFQGDYRVFFGEDNPQLRDFDALQNIYTKNDNLMIVLAPKDGNVFSKETLEAIHWLTARCWEEMPYSTRVDSLSNFVYTEGTEDDLIVHDLVEDPEALNPELIEKIKAFALAEPVLIHRLVNPEGSVTGVNTTFYLPGKKLTEPDEVFAVVRDLEKRFHERYPNIDTYFSGVLPLNMAFIESSKNDMMTLVPLMYLFLLPTMLWSFLSITSAILTFTVGGICAASTMGFAGWVGIVLTIGDRTHHDFDHGDRGLDSHPGTHAGLDAERSNQGGGSGGESPDQHATRLHHQCDHGHRLSQHEFHRHPASSRPGQHHCLRSRLRLLLLDPVLARRGGHLAGPDLGPEGEQEHHYGAVR